MAQATQGVRRTRHRHHQDLVHRRRHERHRPSCGWSAWATRRAKDCDAAWSSISRRRWPASSVRSRRPSAWPASPVKGVHAGIAGDHIRSINSRGVIAVSRKDNEIGAGDVERVVEAAKAIAIPMDREIIHVIPQEFIVDDQDGIKDPVGMSGVRLEAEVHIITGAVTSAKNICRSIQRAGFKVCDLVLEPLASSHAVLGDDERDLGVVLLDVGGGTTDVAVFFEGSIRHTAIVPFGGSNVTNDIAIGLRTPIDKAEQIKIQQRVRAGLAGLLAGDGDGAGRRRPRRPRDLAPRAGLDDRAAPRGDLLARQQGGEEEPLRRAARRRRCADRGHVADAGHRRAGRAGVRDAGAPRRAAGTRRAVGQRGRPALTRPASGSCYTPRMPENGDGSRDAPRERRPPRGFDLRRWFSDLF